MTEVKLTHAAVKALAASLANVDSSSLTHTQRIETIAAAFGWKGDALMHALKKSSAPMEKAEIAALVNGMGIDGLSRWLPDLMARGRGGIYLVCGELGQSPRNIARKLADVLGRDGRGWFEAGNDDDAAVPSDAAQEAIAVVKLLAVGNNVGNCIRYARTGRVVLAPLMLEAYHDIVGYYERRAREAGFFDDLSRELRGILVTRKLSSLCSCGSKDSGCAKCFRETPGYDGRVYAANVVSIESAADIARLSVARPSPLWPRYELAINAISKARNGDTDMDEVGRVFGRDVEQRIEAVEKAGLR